MSGHLPSERNEKETSDINALVNPSGAALAHHNSGIAPSKAFVQALKNFRSWGGAITAILTWLYVGSLAILLLVLERWGERHWFFSLLLFSPPQTFLLPLVILVPLALCTRPKLLGWHISTIIGVCFGYMTFRWTPLPRPEAGSLVVVTHNVGQGNRQQFVSFLDAQKPQIVVLQDARYRASDYSHLFPDYYVSARGEFMLLSRDLIQESMIVESPKWHGRPLAARFEVIHDGKPLVIYDVHMPTPRQQFNRFLSGRVVRDLFSEEEGPAFSSYREWLDARVELAHGLANVISAEKQPFIACGDFNMPDHGQIYHIFAGKMTDGFAKAGRGWGLTFPGGPGHPLAMFNAWLRIDFAFAGSGWKPLFCNAEPGRKSQHHAVVAHFVPATL